MAAALTRSFLSLSLDTYDLKAQDRFHQVEDLLLETIFSITTNRFSRETAEVALQNVEALPGRVVALKELANLNKAFRRFNWLDLALKESAEQKKTDITDHLNLDAKNYLSKLLCKAKVEHLQKGLEYLKAPLKAIAEEPSQKILGDHKVRLPRSTFRFFQAAIAGVFPLQGREISRGFFGAVSIKSFKKEHAFAYKQVLEKEEAIECMRREILAYMLLKHPNILAIEAVDEKGIYLELAADAIFNVKSKQFSRVEQKRCLLEIAKAILCVHEAGLIHKDIKLENVLFIYLTTPFREKMLLCDFGIVVNAQEDREYNGTWVPPEMYCQLTPYSQKVDSWAFGVLAYEFITGYRPFNRSRDITQSYIERVSEQSGKPCSLRNPYFIGSVRHRFIKIVKKCLHGDPEKRLSMQKIIECFEKITPMNSCCRLF